MKTLITIVIVSLSLIGCDQLRLKQPASEHTGNGNRFLVQPLGSQPEEETVRVLLVWGKPIGTKMKDYYSYAFTVESDQELVIVNASYPRAPMEPGDTVLNDGPNKLVVKSAIGPHRDGFVFDMKQEATLSINGKVTPWSYTGTPESLREIDYSAFAALPMLEMMKVAKPGHIGVTTYYYNYDQKFSAAFGLPADTNTDTNTDTDTETATDTETNTNTDTNTNTNTDTNADTDS